MDLSISKRDYEITYIVVEGSSSHRLIISNLLYAVNPLYKQSLYKQCRNTVNPLYKQSLCKQCRDTEYPLATACIAGYDIYTICALVSGGIATVCFKS